ncbi:hypothetical protein [Bacillus sp. ISL-37]|uniref:hypothetical protein n=1 Tax=Bacillus sp. ISL-37 TaxID=2819123 RepID=UPI001BE86B41|nr:hypothetical protein [Bacillus sp. ISL-37]
METGMFKSSFQYKFQPFFMRESFYWRFSIFIGEKINLLAISTSLLAKIKLYWRTGNSGRFFPVRAPQFTYKIKHPFPTKKPLNQLD